MKQSRMSVLVVDDHPLFRKGAGQLLEMDDAFELVGEAASGQEGIELAIGLRPDIILMDLNMKGMNGIHALQKIKVAGLESLVIVLTVSDTEDDLVAALRAGADGYLLKDMEPEELLLKLRRAAQGRVVLDDAVTALVAHALREENQSPSPNDASLTAREEETLSLIAAGMSSKAIARELGISDGTVKVHVKHLLRKLRLSSRLEAAVWALEHGYSKPSDR